MELSQLMSKDVVTVEPSFSLDDAIRVFEQCGFRHLPVEQQGRLVGMLSDRDVSLATGWILSAQREMEDGGGAPKTVREIMHSPIVALRSDRTLEEAVATVLDGHFSGVPVVDGKEQIVGIITTTDLLRAFVDHSLETDAVIDDSTPVSECMSAPVITLGPDDLMEDAIGLCKKKGFRHVPIQEGEQLVGMVSDRDLRYGMGQELISDMIAEELGRLEVARTPLSALMATDVVTIGHQESLAAAAARMLERRMGALPVVHDKRLVGILTASDILTHCREKA